LKYSSELGYMYILKVGDSVTLVSAYRRFELEREKRSDTY